MTRDNLFLFGYFFECIVVSTVMGWIFFGSEDGIQSIQTKKSGLYTAVAMQAYLMTIFMVYKTVYDMRIFDRDRQDRMFDVGPYLISQFIVQLPSNIIFPAIYSIIMVRISLLYWKRVISPNNLYLFSISCLDFDAIILRSCFLHTLQIWLYLK